MHSPQLHAGEKRQRDERESQPHSSLARDKKFVYKSRAVESSTPSILDGLLPEKDALWRRQYCRIIQRAGQNQKIPQWGIWTAMLLCHRFFAIKSMKRNDRFQIATACLFLASKLEESVRTLTAVIRETEKQRFESTKPIMLKKLDDPAHMDVLKDETLQAERAVLYTLGFDLNITHPYKHILTKLKELGLLETSTNQLTQAQRNFIQNAWNFVNDSHRSLICLQHPPEHIACAALYLSNRMTNTDKADSNLPLPPGHDFFSYFKTTPELMAQIGDQMLEIYEVVKLPPPTTSSTSPVSNNQEGGSSQSCPTAEAGFKTEQSTPEDKPDQQQQQQSQQQTQQQQRQQQQQLSHGNRGSNGESDEGQIKVERGGSQ
ncbi:MAG: hypothetical protein WDW38_002765 [Sanguina aurantia]